MEKNPNRLPLVGFPACPDDEAATTVKDDLTVDDTCALPRSVEIPLKPSAVGARLQFAKASQWPPLNQHAPIDVDSFTDLREAKPWGLSRSFEQPSTVGLCPNSLATICDRPSSGSDTQKSGDANSFVKHRPLVLPPRRANARPPTEECSITTAEPLDPFGAAAVLEMPVEKDAPDSVEATAIPNRALGDGPPTSSSDSLAVGMPYLARVQRPSRKLRKLVPPLSRTSSIVVGGVTFAATVALGIGVGVGGRGSGGETVASPKVATEERARVSSSELPVEEAAVEDLTPKPPASAKATALSVRAQATSPEKARSTPKQTRSTKPVAPTQDAVAPVQTQIKAVQHPEKGSAEQPSVASRQSLRIDKEASKRAYRDANADFLRGRLDSAQRGFRSALQTDPGNHLAWRGLGMTLEKRDLRRKALACFERYLRSAPDASDAGRSARGSQSFAASTARL